MTHHLLDRDISDSDAAEAPEFLVLRQNPATRAYAQVGRLSCTGGMYEFRYITHGEGDQPLPEFPDLHQVYRSPHLFATFANHVMTPRRDSYRQYLRMIGLDSQTPDPFEVLARTWGDQVSDTVQLLPIPRVDGSGGLQTRFLVHGGRHVDPEAAALRTLRVGDQLDLRREPDNAQDPRAVLVLTSAADPSQQRRLGYVPAPLAPFIHALWDAGTDFTVIAEHINLPGSRLVSNQMRLLARLEATVGRDFDVEAALGS